MTELRVADLRYSYGKSDILNDINLLLTEPGLTCIIGPNGVGKSTLVKCINRILTPDQGSVTLDSSDVQDLHLMELARQMAFVPVTTGSPFSLNVMETVMLGRHPHSKPGSRSHDLKVVYQALKMVDMSEYALRSAGALSAGQLQRVAIAKGIAQEPKILILDEPTANLDIRHQILVTELLEKLAKENGMIVLMISHDLNIASKYADKIIVMSKPGVIHSVGTPNEVVTEDMIREVYRVNCVIVDHGGRPHVMLDSAIPLDDVCGGEQAGR